MIPGSGSRWRRWDPHIHAPGTIISNQFDGPDPWRHYFDALEARTPRIEALGITDYYCLECYEQVVREKAAGRLPGCGLIFANVELRLNFATIKGNWANLHLLVNPEDPDHVIETRRFLANLTYSAHEDTYKCSRDDLMRLGVRSGGVAGSPAALERGAGQFKVTFGQLKDEYRKSGWAKDNILVAVAGGDDGTSGLRDASDATNRREVESFAHIVLASSTAQREFWLGDKAASVEELRVSYNGLKPCIHGSDAHKPSSVGLPDGDRYTWIKGDATFDALRQACIDPRGRAFVGSTPPIAAGPAEVIGSVRLHGAPWAATPDIHLNPGLVAVIGARGSGKTALADIIARGCDAGPSPGNQQSFLSRASDFLKGAEVTLTWGAGDQETRSLAEQVDADSYPRARYLSQQFVETLCSSRGMTDELLQEVERVVFEAHPASDRDGAVGFDDLRDMRAMRFHQAREREERALASLSEQIGVEFEKAESVGGLERQVKDKEALVSRTEAERARLVAKGSEGRIAYLQEITAAAERVRGHVRFYNVRSQDLSTLSDEVSDRRKNKAPEALLGVRRHHQTSGLEVDEWNSFLTDYVGDVDGILAERLKQARKAANDWKGRVPGELGDPSMSYIGQGDELIHQPLAKLEAEIDRLQGQISIDKATAVRFGALSNRLVQEKELLSGLRVKLDDARGARQRAVDLQGRRETSYRLTFDCILAEQNVLASLYAPVHDRLVRSGGSLNKLSFSVTRSADVAAWALRGEEELIDLRRGGQFRGRGALQKLAEVELKAAWESGDGQAASSAMKSFMARHQAALLDQARVATSEPLAYRAWLKRFAQWLFDTSHVTINYSIRYDGTDIRKLSPGTRGIVLLLLYLALDDADDRPLIIDQPEENLDPQSIFDELVGLFTKAKTRRQVIIVTHNANLVVNTDADQVIVASVGLHTDEGLPPISYLSGGLERADIRELVCKILEGGEPAFRERARRLRVRLER